MLVVKVIVTNLCSVLLLCLVVIADEKLLPQQLKERGRNAKSAELLLSLAHI